MIEKSLNYIYNLRYLICVPYTDIDLYYGFKDTFNNVILFAKNKDEDIFFEEFFKANNIRKVIFVDYIADFEKIVNFLDKSMEIGFIFTKSLSSLSDENNKKMYDKILEHYDSHPNITLGLIDENLYSVLKGKKYNVKLLKLNSNLKIKNDSCKTIGLLNNEEDFRSSFYNELSSLTLIDKKAKLFNPSIITKNFCKNFNIDYEKVKEYENLIANNEINLYINFTNANILPFIDSMNNHIPCLLGNTALLDKSLELKEYLVLHSDDDISEIAQKIDIVINKKDIIFKLYENFKKDYEQEVEQLKKEYLGFTESKNIEKKYEFLISVIVPIYNVEQYLATTLKSIEKAMINDMEIILINDGSTDNSEAIASKFAQKYPNTVRYIKQENHGLGNVRNLGLKEAKGKYITSIDSDDKINSNFFKEALSYCHEDIDIIIYDWLSVNPNTGSFITPAMDKGLNISNKFKNLLYTSIMPSTCNKIIKKSLYDNLNIRFPELKYEDFSTNPFIIMEAISIKYINKPYYEYTLRNDSIMHNSIDSCHMIEAIKIVEDRLKIYKDIVSKVDVLEFKNYNLWWRVEEFIINPLYKMSDDEIKKYIEVMYKYIYETIHDLYHQNDFVEKIILELDNETQEYLQKRNKSIIDKTFYKFILENKKHYKLLTSDDILYHNHKKINNE